MPNDFKVSKIFMFTNPNKKFVKFEGLTYLDFKPQKNNCEFPNIFENSEI